MKQNILNICIYLHELKMCVCHSALQPPLSSSEPVSLSGGESQVQSQISWRNKQPQSYWILLWSGVINRQEKRSEITFKTFGIKKWIDPLIKQTAAIHSGDLHCWLFMYCADSLTGGKMYFLLWTYRAERVKREVESLVSNMFRKRVKHTYTSLWCVMLLTGLNCI